MSSALRNYIKSVVSGDGVYKVASLRKRIILLESQKKNIDSEYFKLKDKLNQIDQQQKLKEIEKMEKQDALRKKYKKMEGNLMKNELADI